MFKVMVVSTSGAKIERMFLNLEESMQYLNSLDSEDKNFYTVTNMENMPKELTVEQVTRYLIEGNNEGMVQ